MRVEWRQRRELRIAENRGRIVDSVVGEAFDIQLNNEVLGTAVKVGVQVLFSVWPYPVKHGVLCGFVVFFHNFGRDINRCIRRLILG